MDLVWANLDAAILIILVVVATVVGFIIPVHKEPNND